jgi:LemA protein
MEWVLIGVVVVLLFVVIGVYNGLVRLRQNVNQGVADIDAQLRQRHDLIPNLVESVKGYATHERETLDSVTKARAAAESATGPADQAAKENVLTQSLRSLIAV